MLIEVGAAWKTTREKQHVCIREVLDVLKLEVSLDGNAVGSFHKLTARDADSLDIYTTSAEDVNRSQTFDFLEAVGEKFIYLSHNFIPFLSYYSINIVNFASVKGLPLLYAVQKCTSGFPFAKVIIIIETTK